MMTTFSEKLVVVLCVVLLCVKRPADASISSVLSSAKPNDKFLDLSYRTDWKDDNGWFTKHIVKAQEYCHIDISSSCLGNDGLKQFYSAITFMKEVKLELRTNRLTTEAATFLFNSLVNNTENITDSHIESSNNTTQEGDSVGDTVSESQSLLHVSHLDIGLNDIGLHGEEIEDEDDKMLQQQRRAFTNSIRNLLECNNCPREIRMDYCGLGPPTCRAIGKGIVKRSMTLQNDGNSSVVFSQRRLRELYLGNNDAIGDAGVAALAAALRTSPSTSNDPVLDVLDLSSCGIGDAGAEALALAIRKNPACVRKLILSNNHISNSGAISIARALSSNNNKNQKKEALKRIPFLVSIDLSNNKDIGDSAAVEFAKALECGAVNSVLLRSCEIRAEGAAAFGKALCAIAVSNSDENMPLVINVDLSGNLLGTYQIKKKAKGADLLKSKASATAASYMNFMKKGLQSGLKNAGIDVSGVMGSFTSSAESDDDEEELMKLDGSYDPGVPKNKATLRCGARSFADSIISYDEDKKTANDDEVDVVCSTTCNLGMRHCFLDKGAADSFAAAIIKARKDYGIELVVDSSLNTEFEDEHIRILQDVGDLTDPVLNEMAERYMKALEVLKDAQQRAALAARSAASRARAENELNSLFNGGDDEYDDFDRFPGDYDDSYDTDDYN